MTSDTDTQEIDPISAVVRGLEGDDVDALRALTRQAQDRAWWADRHADSVRREAREQIAEVEAAADDLRARIAVAVGMCPGELRDDELVALVRETYVERAEALRERDAARRSWRCDAYMTVIDALRSVADGESDTAALDALVRAADAIRERLEVGQ